MPLYYLNQYFTTVLSTVGGIDSSQTSGIALQSVSGVDITKPGVICVTFADPLLTTNAEYITYKSINGSNELVGAARGAEGFSAKSHSENATVAFVVSESHVNNLVTSLKDGWVPCDEEAWTYASATTITVPSDATARYAVGDKIRLKQGGGFLYFYIVGVSTTTLTITGGSDYTLTNTTITDHAKSSDITPVGFPQWFACTVGYTGFTSNPSTTMTFSINGRTLLLVSDARIATSNATTFTLTGLPVACTTLVSQMPIIIRDNGNDALGSVRFSSSTVLTFAATAAGASFTSSGSKGFLGLVLSYKI